MDGQRLALAHPRLGRDVMALLCIPALEDTVHEVLDSFGAAPTLESIQASIEPRYVISHALQASKYCECE